ALHCWSFRIVLKLRRFIVTLPQNYFEVVWISRYFGDLALRCFR
ncbi:11936_t:CDS:2, partial [Dentiscutata erythropus]